MALFLNFKMPLYNEIKPYDNGMLEVGCGNSIYWDVSGNPDGKAALAAHGGPGSGSNPWWRSLFDPSKYKIILFDQRGCGKSLPNAGNPNTDLSGNTTHHSVGAIESLRQLLGIDKWLILGSSWDRTLSLAYAHSFPNSVSQMVLFGVTTGRHSEFDWAFRDGNRIFFLKNGIVLFQFYLKMSVTWM